MIDKLNALVDDCIGANRDTIAQAIQDAYGLGFLDGERCVMDEIKKSINKLDEVLP